MLKVSIPSEVRDLPFTHRLVRLTVYEVSGPVTETRLNPGYRTEVSQDHLVDDIKGRRDRDVPYSPYLGPSVESTSGSGFPLPT